MKCTILLSLIALTFGTALLAPTAFAKTEHSEVSTADAGGEKTLPRVPAALSKNTPLVPVEVNTKAKVYYIYQSRSVCGICVAVAPEIIKEYKKMHGKGAELIMLNVDATTDAAIKWIKKAKMKFPVFFMPQTQDIPFPYTGKGLLPCMVALDADGNKLGEANASDVAPFLRNWKKLVREVEKKKEKEQHAEVVAPS